MAAQPDPPNAATGPICAEIAGNRLLLIEQGAERLRTLLEMIDEAETSFRILFYMFTEDSAGQAVRDRLVSAAQRGVKVTLLIDGFGCTAKPDFFAGLRDAGGHFCVFHPRYSARYLLRNHQKLVVADDRRAIVGGANISQSYLEDVSEKRWRDLWLLVEGPAAHHAGRYFDALFRWTTSHKPRMRDLRRLVTRYTQRRGKVQWVFSGPMQRRNPWPERIARDLQDSNRFDLIAAYFAPPFGMTRRIRHLARTGCVRIITAGKTDNNATIAAARFTYSRLLRRGAEIYEYQPVKLHTKLAVFDEVVHIGSSNFDFRSLYLNLEVMLRVDDPGFAAQMRGYFEREMADCLRITPEIHKARASLPRRVKWAISNFLVTSMDYTVTRRLNFGAEK
ncbi:phosphatidylserine/phosphatidylglycerophosphate/cardiolipin synthase family protein [Sphingomonas ginkgonis]|uniref:Phospholipase D n=1 Tax=Sphingomonas ginkgonis TaxID=2315330 RepID=A0A3R9X626_9SPHN|nr:phosphatidylserine/phosphatidylglycerophosphate/cardiolipin synthase family protein [Sphingomonas ginkgonis]RST29635.1 phosphatidylserine/phosphatidylglycerophosphate/cardiolipin synthase family protein [Sphingomonas ginkgonis]